MNQEEKIKILKDAIEKWEGEKMTIEVMLSGLKLELNLLEVGLRK